MARDSCARAKKKSRLNRNVDDGDKKCCPVLKARFFLLFFNFLKVLRRLFHEACDRGTAIVGESFEGERAVRRGRAGSTRFGG